MSEIHVAGQLVEWVQRCSRCGYVLNDYRNSMIPEGDPPPRGWAVGAFVEVVDCGTFRASTVTDDLPTCTVEDQWIRIAAQNAKDANDRLASMKAERDRLRAALVGIISVDGRAELEQMEVVIRSMPAPAQDKAASIDAIHALLATLPVPSADDATNHTDDDPERYRIQEARERDDDDGRTYADPRDERDERARR